MSFGSLRLASRARSRPPSTANSARCSGAPQPRRYSTTSLETSTRPPGANLSRCWLNRSRSLEHVSSGALGGLIQSTCRQRTAAESKGGTGKDGDDAWKGKGGLPAVKEDLEDEE